MSRSKELIKERLNPAKELYRTPFESPHREGSDQHRLYKSTGYHPSKPPTAMLPGKWSAYV